MKSPVFKVWKYLLEYQICKNIGMRICKWQYPSLNHHQKRINSGWILAFAFLPFHAVGLYSSNSNASRLPNFFLEIWIFSICSLRGAYSLYSKHTKFHLDGMICSGVIMDLGTISLGIDETNSRVVFLFRPLSFRSSAHSIFGLLWYFISISCAVIKRSFKMKQVTKYNIFKPKMKPKKSE